MIYSTDSTFEANLPAKMGQVERSEKRVAFADQVEPFVRPIDVLATLINDIKASFTAFSVGNAFATSGLSNTTLWDSWYAS